MNKLKIKTAQSNEKITPFGGSLLIFDLLEHLGIIDALDRDLPSPRSNRGISPSKKILPAILSMVCGGSSFSDIDKLSNDYALKEIIGIPSIPDSSTINRWFNASGGSSNGIAVSNAISVIGHQVRDIAIKGLKQEGVKEVTIDQDATFTEVFKNGAEYCYKKFKAFSSMTCFIAGSGYCIDEVFSEGNTSPQSGILSQLQRVNEHLMRNGIHVSNVRHDSAGYQASLLNYCFDNGIHFYIGGDLDQSVRLGISEIPEDSWETYSDRYGIQSDVEEVSEFVHSMNRTTSSFRMIVVRKRIKSDIPNVPELLGDRYSYRVIATNSDLPIEKVVHFYNMRGVCEYYIKEVKYGFNMKKLPSGELGGNGLWFKTGMLAYNLITYLKRIILAGEYKNKEMKSIRYLLISIAGKLVSHGRQLTLKLACSQRMLKRINEWRIMCLRH